MGEILADVHRVVTGSLVRDPVVPVASGCTGDIVHTRVDGYRPLSLDLYAAGGDARALASTCTEAAGCWDRGGRPGPCRRRPDGSLARMAAQGLAVAAVDYRLSGEARFPAQRHDVVATCRWLLDDEASPVRGLPVVAFGASAGGQLAALCGLDPALPVRAVALWYSVTDLLHMPDDLDAAGVPADRGPGSREAQLLGAPAADVPDLARDASPVTHVRPGAPPFLLLHGDADHAVPARQSERLHTALLAVGASSTLDLVPGYDHMFAGMPDADVETLVDRTTRFLQHLRLAISCPGEQPLQRPPTRTRAIVSATSARLSRASARESPSASAAAPAGLVRVKRCSGVHRHGPVDQGRCATT